MKRRIIIALAFLIGFTSQVFAQTGTTQLPSPTGSEILSVTPTSPFPTGMNQTVYLTQLREAQGYLKTAPLTGATVIPPPNTSRLIIQPAGTIAALTIQMPDGPTPGNLPVDGAELCIFSTQIVTTLTMQVRSGSGETLNAPATTFAAANQNGICWAYSASNKTWDRSQ
jgi:hypothetical protein